MLRRTAALAALVVAAPLLAQEPLVTFDGENAGDFFGASVSNAGDIDGDGVDEFIIGARHQGESQETTFGKAYVYSGADSTLLWSWVGENLLDEFGVAVAGGGDVDNDGTADVAVGAWKFGGEEENRRGKAYVYSGATGEMLHTWEGEGPEDGFGFSLDVMGDFDGDGYDDVLVGAYLHDGIRGIDSGKVYVYSGMDGELLLSQDGDQAGDNLGWSVSGARDVTNNGFSDFIIGANQFDGEFELDCGKAYVIAGPDGVEVRTWEGEEAFVHLGVAVAGVGDMNDDDVDDLLVASDTFSGPNGQWSGRVYAYSGIDGEPLWIWDGEGAFDRFGSAVAPAGDLDGDGFPDALVGAYQHDGVSGADSGRVYAFSGDEGTLLATWEGEEEGDGFGFAIDRAGDLDDSQTDDVLVGAWRFDGDGGADQIGRAYVYEGLVPNSVLVDTSCLSPCPGAVFMVSATGYNASSEPADLTIALIRPEFVELDVRSVEPGPFEYRREMRFPPDKPPANRCPIDLRVEARLDTAPGDMANSFADIEAVPVN